MSTVVEVTGDVTMQAIELQVSTATETNKLSGFDESEKAIAKVKAYGSLTLAVDGIAKVEDAHKQVKKLRIDITKRGKSLRDGANAYCKAVIAEERRLIGEVEPIEDALAAQRKIHDDEEDRKREAKLAAKRAILQGRIERLTQAGCQPGSITAIEVMTDTEFEKYYICEAMKAESAREQAEIARRMEFERSEAERLHNERRQKLQIRIARMEGLGVAIGSVEQVEQLSDEQFEKDYQFAKKAIDERRAAEEAAHQAEIERQAEELRIRTAELAAERVKMEAEREAMLHNQQVQRRQLEEQQAEVRRQQEEIRQAEELKEEQERQRLLAERIAEDNRIAEIARAEAEAAEAARLEALKPEIEKAEAFTVAVRAHAADMLIRIGNPSWAESAQSEIVAACRQIKMIVGNGLG